MTAAAPEITVVIPCHDAERWVGRAIASVLDQAGVAVEVVVVDDGSSDGSLAVIRGFGDRVRWESGPNRGACTARNRGLALARAPYVLFLDADDYVEGPFLAAGRDAVRARGAGLGFGVVEQARDGDRVRYAPPPLGSHIDAFAMLARSHVVPPCGTLWTRALLEEIGGWREPLRRYQDLDIVARALARRPVVTTWEQGAGVAVQHAHAGRISHRVDPRTFADQLAVVATLREAMIEGGLSPAHADALARLEAYKLWRTTARGRDREAFDRAGALFRSLGGRGHHGGRRHVALATLLGLRTKERLAVRLARRRAS
jgi:glycosyltransferase involved in cell wall biosynthesis